MFLKEKSREELERKLGKKALIVDYSPITQKSSFMGISEESAQILRGEYRQGIQFLQLDDVISTGSTVKAIETLLSQVLEDPEAAAQVPVFAVAREIPEHVSFENDPDTWSYSLVIPVLEALSAS
jgi:predicted amidophosphoribosyltransferase